MPKRYFDQIEVGETLESPGVTVTDWHVMQFAGLSMDFFELHTNDEYAKQTEYGRRVAHGLLGLAITDGLKNRSEFQVEAIVSLHCCTVVGFRRADFRRRYRQSPLEGRREASIEIEARPGHCEARDRADQPA